MPLTLLCLLILQTATSPGVSFQVYQVEGELWQVPQLVPEQTPNFDQLRSTIRFESDAFGGVPAPLVTRVHGQIEAPQTGRYGFRLLCDDGARLHIDGRRMLDNDGRHATTAEAITLELAAGWHDLRIEHFDAGGGRYLELQWRPPGVSDFEAIPTRHLRTEADPTRVTSPGPKRLLDEAGRPGDRRPLESVHPGWAVEDIRPAGFEPKVGALAFLPDGRLLVGTFDPLQRDEEKLPDIESKEPDKLYALSNLDGPVEDITVDVVADDLYEPSGLCVVDGVVYVAHRKAITRLLDRDGDGFYETHEDVAGDWEGWNYHQFTFGLVHRAGKLYAGLSTAMAPPAWEGMIHNAAPNGPMRGTIIEVDLETGLTHVIAGGVRTPNGLGLGPNGSLWYADNQGTWMPSNQLSAVIPGRFYGHYNNTNVVPKLPRFPDGGHPSAWCDRPRTPASILMPQGECSNSPTQPLLIPSGPFAGQMLVGELTGGGIRRVSFDRVNGQWQGAVYRFTQGLECGVNRMAWGPDGCLYVGGIGAGGNWNWRGTQFGLQRLRPTGRETLEIAAIMATEGGLMVNLTGPIRRDWLRDPGNYEVRQWRYAPTADYGGPKVEQERLRVTAAAPGPHDYSVRLTIPGLRAGSCVYLRSDPISINDHFMHATEAWYTLNQIPQRPSPRTGLNRPRDTDGIGVGVLPPADAAPLIGRSAGNTMHPAKEAQAPRTGGRTQAELLADPGYITVGDGSGDLVSNTVFGDARIHVEWYAPPGGEGQQAGNSGVYIHDRYELQVLGTLPGDEPLATNEAGAIYERAAPLVNASTGPGTWQAYDIWFTAPRFDGEKKVADARATIFWNGRLIHNDIALLPTGSRSERPEQPVGPLLLQDHSSDAEGPVRYRNVWIAPLERKEYEPGPWRELVPADATEMPAHWTPVGGAAAYRVERGTIIGETRPNTGNTFLATRATYDDFELTLEAWQHPELNSGIQIRSAVDGGVDNRSGVMRGYQVELDPTERAYSAGIYDEARRGWLHPLIDSPYARRAYRKDDWNRIRIVARGPLIQTWINGVPAATMFDALTPGGHIGLQVHDVGGREDPLTVRFRNVRIRELTGSGEDVKE